MLYFIGGAPTAGKSTLGKKVAELLNAQCMSTDQVRSVVRAFASRDQYPELFLEEKYSSPVTYYEHFTPEQVVAREYAQAKIVWKGINEVVKNEWGSNSALVIEGVSIFPDLVMEHYGDSPEYKALFLIDEDGDRIRSVIQTRGLWDDPDTYPDEVKGKEVEFVKAFSSKVKQDALECGFPCIEVTKSEVDLEKALVLLGIKG